MTTEQPRKIIGWKPKHQRLAPITPKPDDAETRQRKQWRTEVENAPKAANPWGEEPSSSPGLLDRIAPDPKTDPQGYRDVLTERLRRLT
jgi:hypothetical protein